MNPNAARIAVRQGKRNATVPAETITVPAMERGASAFRLHGKCFQPSAPLVVKPQRSRSNPARTARSIAAIATEKDQADNLKKNAGWVIPAR